MNKDAKVSILLDLYGKILSKIQFESIDLYYNQDLSLAEIGNALGKSRQGVYDSIRRAEVTLYKLEQSLGLMEKYLKIKKSLKQIKELTCKLEDEIEPSADSISGFTLKSIKSAIEKLINI